MPFRQILLVWLLFAYALLGTDRLSANHHRPKSVRAQVRFLATSWFLRGTAGTNEDRYLVELGLSPKGSAILAYLIDRYPSEYAPLNSEELRSEAGTVLRISRDTSCDIPFGELELRTAPDDPMASQLIKLHYEPNLRTPPRADAVVPCYRTWRW